MQRRRMSFWEFYNWDAWSVSDQYGIRIIHTTLTVPVQSVITGRPPVLNLAQADCRFPEDMEPVVNSQGQLEPGCKRFNTVFVNSLIDENDDRAQVEVPLRGDVSCAVFTAHFPDPPVAVFDAARTRQAHTDIPAT